MEKFPALSFVISSAENYRTTEKYDAFFSNAALHCMKQAEKVVESDKYALRSGDVLSLNLVAKGNVQTLIRGIEDEEYNINVTERNP